MAMFLSITAVLWIILFVLGPASGFVLPRIDPVKGSSYGFGYHYDYNNAGSSWDHKRAYRHSQHRLNFNRWYYHYGHKPQQYYKYKYYPGPGDRHRSPVYSRHKYSPKKYSYRKPAQLRDRIPRQSFRHSRSFNRVRIGR